jgi:hypothetical protein
MKFTTKDPLGSQFPRLLFLSIPQPNSQFFRRSWKESNCGRNEKRKPRDTDRNEKRANSNTMKQNKDTNRKQKRTPRGGRAETNRTNAVLLRFLVPSLPFSFPFLFCFLSRDIQTDRQTEKRSTNRTKRQERDEENLPSTGGATETAAKSKANKANKEGKRKQIHNRNETKTIRINANDLERQKQNEENAHSS